MRLDDFNVSSIKTAKYSHTFMRSTNQSEIEDKHPGNPLDSDWLVDLHEIMQIISSGHTFCELGYENSERF